MHILETISPGLRDAIASLPPEKRRQFVGFACEAATESMRNLDPVTADLLRLLKTRGFLSAEPSEAPKPRRKLQTMSIGIS